MSDLRKQFHALRALKMLRFMVKHGAAADFIEGENRRFTVMYTDAHVPVPFDPFEDTLEGRRQLDTFKNLLCTHEKALWNMALTASPPDSFNDCYYKRKRNVEYCFDVGDI